MEFIKNIKFSFLALVLFILLPIMSIIVVFMALHNYNESYDAILEGFNKKLLSISSVSASFIDGSDHEVISIAKKMHSFTYDKNRDVLYAFDSKSKLQKINVEKGAAIAVPGFEDSNLSNYIIYDIAMDAEKNILYAVTSTQELLSIDLSSKEIALVKKFDYVISAIAFDKGTFYLGGIHTLYQYQFGDAVVLKQFTHIFTSLNFLDNKLYGVNKEENEIYYIDIETLNYHDKVAENFPSKNSILHHLAVDKNHFYAGSDHLMVYEVNSSTVFEDDFARLYRDETAPVYRQYIEPMTAIKLALNLTYHYTFNLLYNDEENNCFYIIDVNEGSEYTPIGSYDVMDADDLLGAENVILRDKTYVSEIKLWEKWGLLKVAYAGIKDSNSNVVAVTGTDVDISIINTKTKNALIQSIIIGILALIIGIFASYYVAIKMINPIQKLKYSALKIAAGNYGDNIFIKSPKELNALSVEFNYMSNELKTTLENFSDYSSSVQAEGVSKELQKRLYQLSCIDDERIKIEGLKESTNVVGIVKKYDIYYVYALDETYDTIVDASQKRVVINDLLKRFLESSSEVEFIDIVKPSEFIILDMNSLVFEDILNKKVIQTNNEFHELVVLDITIKICTDDKGAV